MAQQDYGDCDMSCGDIATAREYYKAYFGKGKNKGLKFARSAPDTPKNDTGFTLLCTQQDCCFRLKVAKGKRKYQDENIHIDVASSDIQHRGNECECLSVFKHSAKVMAQSDFLLNHQAYASSIPLTEVGAHLQQEGYKGVNKNKISRAGKVNAITGKEIVDHGFGKMPGLLAGVKQLNDGVEYHYETQKDSSEFHRVVFIPSYAKHALQEDGGCVNVIGIDSSHMYKTELKDSSEDQEVQQILATLFAQEPGGGNNKVKLYLSKLTLTAVTGRTLENKQIIFAIGISYHESKDDIRYVLDFMKEKGLRLNNKRMTVYSDRGAALLPAIAASLDQCLHMACPLHLLRNLQSHKWCMKSHKGTDQDLTPLYWAARNARCKSDYDVAMQRMENFSIQGGLMAKWLLDVKENWQLYIAVAWGNPLYGFLSDNLVEHVFSWLKRLKGYGAPYYFLKGTCKYIEWIYILCIWI